MPFTKEAGYTHTFVFLYFILALIELTSFYLTGLENQGKYPVEYTI